MVLELCTASRLALSGHRSDWQPCSHRTRLRSQNNDEPMQLRVTCREVSIGGRRWVEYVVEQRHQYAWTVLATFRDMNQCCAFLLARPGAQIEFMSG